VTVTLLYAPASLLGNFDLKLRLRVSTFPALAFGFNSSRRTIILFHVFPISRLIYLGIMNYIQFSQEMSGRNFHLETQVSCRTLN
jgi:hypothetical protein